MRTKKILALILALLMLAGSLTACKSAYDNPNDYITLPDVGKIFITSQEMKDALDEEIESIREGAAGTVFEPLSDEDAVIEKGDQVLIDFDGTPDKEGLSDSALEALSGENYYLTIGSDSSKFPVDYTTKNDNNSENDDDEVEVIVEGFEEQLIGKKAGDKLTITAKFSNTYNSKSELQNVTVTYEVTVKAIARITITEDHDLEISYTVTDNKDDVSDILLPVITTEADETTEEPETTEDPDSKASETTGESDDTTAEETTEAPDFSELFPDEDEFDVDFEKSDETAFGEVFTVDDIARYLIGKHLYEEFAIQITVPEDYEDDDYADYLGKEIYFTITINDATSQPEWTDYFVNRYTDTEYETASKYEEHLKGELRKSLAYEAIADATVVKEYPYDEWEIVYKNYCEQYLLEFLQEADDLSSPPSLNDYTPGEIADLVSDSDYDEIRTKASYSARESVKERLTMEALFKLFDITLSRKEFKERMAEEEDSFDANYFYYYYYYGILTFDQYVSYMGGEDYFKLQIKYEKLLEILPEKVTFEDDAEGDTNSDSTVTTETATTSTPDEA